MQTTIDDFKSSFDCHFVASTKKSRASNEIFPIFLWEESRSLRVGLKMAETVIR